MPAGFYETRQALSEYLLFHYGAPAEILPWTFGPVSALNFPARCVSECLDPAPLPAQARALDLGCAVGRSTFELARHCAEVLGIDNSHSFIQAAQELRKSGFLKYAYSEEGLLTTPATATVPPEIDRRRVSFAQADAQALPPTLGTFDVVLLANLLDRLPEPGRCLRSLAGLLRPGGQLILTTPCTWLESYTPRSNWLGGFESNGCAVRTLDTLRTLLEPNFKLLRQIDLPFLIREHARKFQWSVALATVWIHP